MLTISETAVIVRLVATFLVASVGSAPAQQASSPTAGWMVSSPEAQGLRMAPFNALSEAIREGTYGYIDHMLVVRNGFVVLDERYDQDYRVISQGHRSALGCGEGSCRGEAEVHQYNYLHPVHHPFYRGRNVHTLQSVTKSIAATVIGAAIGRGAIPDVHAPLLTFLETYDLSRVDPRLRRATLDDLLTMRTGIEWHETDRPFDETNTTLQLERSDDWVQFTLNQPMDANPGEKWAYNSGGSHLMSAVIRHATGRTIDVYADEVLFNPLGITDYHWKRTPAGLPDTEGGLYLEAVQLAKIGLLYLHDGIWDGRRILPAGWVERATARLVDSVNAFGWGYGYQWWRLDRDETVVWAGLGFGGQYLLILPQHQLIGVITSWNVFGGRRPSTLGALLDALLGSLGE